jgi:hypothetical protein
VLSRHFKSNQLYNSSIKIKNKQIMALKDHGGCTLSSLSAFLAQARDFDVVRLGAEAMAGSGGGNYLFYFGAGNGEAAAALAASEVMMVAVESVSELDQAAAGHYDVFDDA